MATDDPNKPAAKADPKPPKLKPPAVQKQAPKPKADKLTFRAEAHTISRAEALAHAGSVPGGGMVGYPDVMRASVSIGLHFFETLPRPEFEGLADRLFLHPDRDDHRNMVIGYMHGGLAPQPYVPAEEHATVPLAQALHARGASKDEALHTIMGAYVEMVHRCAQLAEISPGPGYGAIEVAPAPPPPPAPPATPAPATEAPAPKERPFPPWKRATS